MQNPVEKIASNPITSVAVMVFSALTFDFATNEMEDPFVTPPKNNEIITNSD